MIPKHIKNYTDLQTLRRDVCDGFLSQALAKTEKAEPYIERAKSFYKKLQGVKTVDEVLALKDFSEELISAGGFSEKAKTNLTTPELENALKEIIKKIMRESNHEFREEIVYRYLLTKGDSLGGSMRNVTGALAGQKLTLLILEKLKAKEITPRIKRSDSDKIQRIFWPNRLILFDVKPPIMTKNIDLILVDCSKFSGSEAELLKDYSRYLSCGELKGGIDPAGADEHWKTANSALDRIRTCFDKRKCPSLFFVGAAIEAGMAKEIFNQLNEGSLAHAANLNHNDQLNDLVEWLLSL